MLLSALYLILYIKAVYLTKTNPLFDTLMDSIDCGCDRATTLNISKTKVHVHNFETESLNTYNILNAAEGLLSQKDFNKKQCIQMFIPGIFNVEVADSLCSFSKIKCEGKKTLAIIIDHRAYTNGNVWDETLNSIPFYKNAVKYVKPIGVHLGHFMTKILTHVDRNLVEVVGFSVGAHMAGYMGEIVINETGIPLKRIYAVEPAGPCYHNCKNEHIRIGQADQILSIHCNSGEFGSKLNLTDYDFYSYDGKIQKTCGSGTLNFIDNFFKGLCSHQKCVPIFFNPAISGTPQVSIKCNSASEYLAGNCKNNSRAFVGYKFEAGGAPGVYFFRPKLNLNCNLPFNLLRRN